MTVWTWCLLSILIATYGLDLVADFFEIKSLKPALPKDFEGVYDAREYAKLQEYTAVTTRSGVVQSTFTLVVLLGFWFAGGFNWLDQFVRSLGLTLISSGLVYLGVLWLGRGLLSLPFEIYDTFVIEQRFGFNRTTPATFVADRLKGLALSGILGAGVLVLLLWVLETAGPAAWFYAWIAISILMVFLMFFAPAVILPLFNKFTPLPEGELKHAILRFGEEQRFPIGGIYVMDGSRRSARANAFFTGFGRTKKIALFDTLIESHTVPELVAVLAHEIGHYKLRHVIQHLGLAILNLGIFLFLASNFLGSAQMFGAFGVEQMSLSVGLALFLVVYTPFSRLLSVPLGFLTRRHEYEADAFAARATGDSEPLVSALKKLSRTNLTNLSPHPLQVILHHSHPPVLARIDALRRRANAP